MSDPARAHRDLWDLIDRWDGLGVVVSREASVDAWIFVALHDDRLGVPVGGCRMTEYETPVEGLRDALRLAEGMTWKWASIGLPFGGGKSVIALSRPLAPEERESLLRRFGRLLESLHGSYRTGEDLGTTPEDMELLAEETEYVMGGHGDGSVMDPGPYTALGVLSGMREAVAARLGESSLEGRTVLVQGVGDVGEPLARMLAEEGARLLLADVDRERAETLARELGGSTVVPGVVYDTPCDVFAPCARGGILNRETIPRLRCRVVAGSANNQLERSEDAVLLRDHGILYAPDYVVNAGGALAFGLMDGGVSDRDELRERVRGLGDTLREIFGEAEEGEIPPTVAARRRAERTLRSAQAAASGSQGSGGK